MAHDVFISYSAKDKTTADAVCAMLESDGIRCWIAPRDVLASMEWGEAIIDAIEQSRIMVLVFTANANDSPQIRREVERAVNHGVAILPLRVENVLPGRSLEYFISDVHWLDALTPPLEAHLKNLAGTIKIVLARTEPGAASQEEKLPEGDAAGAGAKAPESAVPRDIAPAPGGSWNARSWTWAAGTAGALVLAAVFIGMHFTSRPAPAGSPQPAVPPAQSSPAPAGPGGTAPAASPLPAPAPAQSASTPPKSAANAPDATANHASSLEQTMAALQQELSSIGTVSFTAFIQNKTDGSTFQNTFVQQVSNVAANPGQCLISFHWKETRNGDTTQDTDGWFLLHDVTSVAVEPDSQFISEVNAAAGQPNIVVLSTSVPVESVNLLRPNNQHNQFPFTNINSAKRFAAAVKQAVGLCGGHLAN